MRDEYPGYSSPGDKHVCTYCFSDYAIKGHIKTIGNKGECTYCNKRRAYICHIDEVLDFILEGIETEWTDPANVAGWNGREGGYQCDVTDGTDLINELLYDECEHKSLVSDIAAAFADRLWCISDPYAGEEAEEARYTWRKFCHQVMHETRFVFYKLKPQEDELFLELFNQPCEVLEYIAEAIKMVGLVKVIPHGMVFFRGRLHSGNKRLETAVDLGPPPLDKAVTNRMSPAGVSLFYGAFDVETAIIEILDGKKESDTHVSIGKFSLLKDSYVIDFSEVLTLPSLFDRENRGKRQQILFLREFIKDLSKSIEKDGREHIEYVPTQIVVEFLRYVFKPDDGNCISGVIYPSSKKKDSKCIAMFVSKEQVKNKDVEVGPNHLLSFSETERRIIKVSYQTERE